MSATNDYIATVHGMESMFATVFFAVLDTGSGLLHYVNAGHEPPLVRHAAADRTSECEVTGPALGLWIGQSWEVRTAQLQPGDSLLGFTDGVTEAMGSSGPVGSDLLRQALEQHTGPATGLIDAVRMQFESPVDQVVVNDDITLLALTRLAPSPFGRGVGVRQATRFMNDQEICALKALFFARRHRLLSQCLDPALKGIALEFEYAARRFDHHVLLRQATQGVLH